MNSAWSDGMSSDCTNLQCTTEDSGVETCQQLCRENTNCNVINFCPNVDASNCGTKNQCCLQTCASETDLQLIDTSNGWDVYKKDSKV